MSRALTKFSTLLVLATNIASIRVLKGMEGRVLRSQHFTAVEVLRSELEGLGIPYKKLDDASHVTAVELKSAKLADSVMKKLDSRGFYVQGKFFLLRYFS